MPDIEVMIGGRSFLVSCQPGEEHFLRSAAAQLDVEAQPLVAAMGRLPETKLLLMAGLMLADRTSAQEDEMRELRARLSTLEDRPEPEARRVEVPVIPPQVPLTFAELAARAEALAERISEKAAAVQPGTDDPAAPAAGTSSAQVTPQGGTDEAPDKVSPDSDTSDGALAADDFTGSDQAGDPVTETPETFAGADADPEDLSPDHLANDADDEAPEIKE